MAILNNNSILVPSTNSYPFFADMTHEKIAKNQLAYFQRKKKNTKHS